MASLHFVTYPLLLLRIQSNSSLVLSTPSISSLQGFRMKKLCLNAISKKDAALVDSKEESSNERDDTAAKKARRAPRRARKKVTVQTSEETPSSSTDTVEQEVKNTPVASDEAPKKTTRRGRKKASSEASTEDENVEKKVTLRRTRTRKDKVEDGNMIAESTGLKEQLPSHSHEPEEDLVLKDDGNDLSYTYSWPPLVCCFGAAQHDFIPSGRPANRLLDHKIHESMKDMFWSPERFFRAPGGSSSRVAVALASLGGRVAFMGKVGDDNHGQNMLYYLNINNVQTRAVKIDITRETAVSRMKILKRGGLRTSSVRPCSEDCLLTSEINIDVLKEAKMFYFNSSSLLDPSMRSATMQAIKFSRKLGSVIFFDLNLPLPLWYSSTETKELIQHAWSSADVIEVTKQELEFLCDITPSEKFDTTDNNKSKFVHYKSEAIMPLWHDDLKVLFVTNGTSKIHYYTAKDNGSVHGMEDPPITPYTGDMSVAGDAIVAALMRMLTVQPDLITDKGYLEHMIKYAISCGVIDQWSLARILGFPPKRGMEAEEEEEETDGVRSITERAFRTVMESVT